jgi:uncharacterized damage-inducible protein DinB
MKVWVLETGSYEERIVQGVFSSAENAMAAWPIDDAKRKRAADRRFRYVAATLYHVARADLAWAENSDGDWALEAASWDDVATVRSYELDRVP